MTTTAPPTAITDILNWQKAHAGTVPYSETAATRLDSDTAHLASATDCSGMVARMFAHFAGLTVGTYTGNECDYGTLVTTDKAQAAAGQGMLPGDCILFDWDGGAWDHIAIYAGGGRIWNHGGPGKGPLDWSLEDNVNNAVKVMVRRFVAWPSGTDTPKEDDNVISKEQMKELTDAIAAAGQKVIDTLHNQNRDPDGNARLTVTDAEIGAENAVRKVLAEVGVLPAVKKATAKKAPAKKAGKK